MFSVLVDTVCVVSNLLDLGAEFYGVIFALLSNVVSAFSGTFGRVSVGASSFVDGSLFH